MTSEPVVEVFNGSCWNTCKRRIAASDASVFLLAEVRLLSHQVAAAIAWCARRGLTAMFEPAAPSALGGLPSGGVAIVARVELGLVPACDLDTCITPHRAIGGSIDVPTVGHVALVAAYLDVGDKWGSSNLAIMAQVGAFLTSAAMPFFAGGNFNNDPASCAELSFHQRAGSVVVAPLEGTCRSSAGTWSVIDYAILNASLAWFVESVGVDGDWPAGPYRPVRYVLHGEIGNKVALAFPRAVRYPTDPPFGPAPRPQSFKGAGNAAFSAWAACVEGNVSEASRRLDDAYSVFARSAERHVALATAQPDNAGDGQGQHAPAAVANGVCPAPPAHSRHA